MTVGGLEFVLSSHENGRPKERTKTFIGREYFLPMSVLFFFGFILYFFYFRGHQTNISFFKFIPFMLIIFGILALILGIRKLYQNEIIKVDGQGITIVKGKAGK